MDPNSNRAAGLRLLKDQLFDKAEEHLKLAVAEADGGGASIPKRVTLRLELAEAQQKQNRLTEAEQTLRQGIHLAAGKHDANGYLSCLDSLAQVFAAQQNFSAVETVLQEGLRLESAMPHPDPLRMARRVHRLGITRYQSGACQDAIPALEKGLELHEQAYGPDHEETARVLSELGAIYRAQGRHPDAQRCLRRSLRYYQGHEGPASDSAMQDLQQLAGSLEESGDISGAAGEYERLLKMKQRDLAGTPDQLAELQFSIAGLYLRWGNFPRGRALLAASIAIFKRSGGPRLAVAYETLAQVEEHSGHFHDALRELDRAGKVWEKCPERTAELAANLEYRAELMDQLRNKREAAWLREQAARLIGRAAGA